jgi:hypothetical protein
VDEHGDGLGGGALLEPPVEHCGGGAGVQGQASRAADEADALSAQDGSGAAGPLVSCHAAENQTASGARVAWKIVLAVADTRRSRPAQPVRIVKALPALVELGMQLRVGARIVPTSTTHIHTAARWRLHFE